MTTKDLGVAVVDRAFQEMAIDAEWSVRDERGFTWWGAWVRQHVWADEAVRSRGETLWHVRARTAAYAAQPDEPSTYTFVDELNAMPGTSAYAFDPEDGSVSARCGVFTYDVVDGWLERFFRLSVALQSSIAWLQVPAEAAGRALDDEPHPTSGPRKDPDDMLNFAGAFPGTPPPFTPRDLRDAAVTLAGEGVEIEFEQDPVLLRATFAVSADAVMGWGMSLAEHPLLGHGVLVRLFAPWQDGPARTAWLANGLNLAESADWSGEDRPHALGAWTTGDGFLVHTAFFPSVLIGGADDGDRLIPIRNLLAWGSVRARFVADRLPWLAAAARARYPDDELSERRDHIDDDPETDDEPDSTVPVRERSFGPASRTPRPRPTTAESRAGGNCLVVDPGDPAAFHEIDDAVAAAEDGDRIIVRPGTYRRPVTVDRAVHIEGDGPIAAIRLEPVGGEALGIAASGASIEGLTIRPAEAGNDGASWSAVAVHDAAVTIEGCDLTSHLGATVWVGGPSSRVVLLGCTLSGGSQNAVWVVEEGRAELAACVVTGNRWAVMARGPHSAIAIDSCEITDNLDGGVVVDEGGTLSIDGSTIARNGAFGILLDGAAPASRVDGLHDRGQRDDRCRDRQLPRCSHPSQQDPAQRHGPDGPRGRRPGHRGQRARRQSDRHRCQG